MKKIVTAFAIFLALAAGAALAHHPAEDIVDDDIYAMINDMVSDTPHVTMDFDDTEDTTTITADSVSVAEDLIDDGLLADLSLLDEEVTVTITFGDDVEAASRSVEGSKNGDNWTERDDWGREVIFTVDTLLCIDPPCKSK